MADCSEFLLCVATRQLLHVTCAPLLCLIVVQPHAQGVGPPHSIVVQFDSHSRALLTFDGTRAYLKGVLTPKFSV